MMDQLRYAVLRCGTRVIVSPYVSDDAVLSTSHELIVSPRRYAQMLRDQDLQEEPPPHPNCRCVPVAVEPACHAPMRGIALGGRFPA